MFKLKNKNNQGIYSAPNKQAGFTLIELIVSISIMTLLTVLFLANYKSSNKRTDVIMTAQQIVSDIHLAQNNALGLVKYNGLVPAGGWGISFDTSTTSYMMFADLNAPGTLGYLSYDPLSEGSISYGARPTSLSPNIIISSLKVGNNSVPNATVTFLPPDPQTNISSAGATSTALLIQIQDKSNLSNIKTIRVNFLGLAEVID